MEKQKIYLDTSVISAYFDIKKPVRQIITQKWIENDIKDYEVFIPTLVIDEINHNTNIDLKNKMLNLLNDLSVEVLEVNDEILRLSERYRKDVLNKEINDTIHIAVASFNKINAIVSWNFRHIVNLKTIEKIHKVTVSNDLPIIEVISIENIGGYKYGNI
ncbi:MAG: PIN domain-containing protein [bacterium]